MRFTILFLLIGLYACGQQTENKNHKIDPTAKKLNDSAVLIVMNTQDYEKAILLLNQATQIDSNYLIAYTNKLSFQLHLNQLDKALLSAYSLKRIKPDNPEYYVTIGMIYDLKSDTITSKRFFDEAATRYNAILDTMSATNKDYDMLLMNKAVNLVLIGQQQEANDILKQLYDKHKDESYREILASFMNKSKQDILNNLFQTK